MFTKQQQCTLCTPSKLKIVKHPDERRHLKHFKQLKKIVTSMIFCLIHFCVKLIYKKSLPDFTNHGSVDRICSDGIILRFV